MWPGKKFLMTTKPEGGGVKALVVGPLKKELFLRLPLYRLYSNFVCRLYYRSVPCVEKNIAKYCTPESSVQHRRDDLS